MYVSAIRVVNSDTSSTGYGGYVVEHGHMIANGLWLEEGKARLGGNLGW